MGEIEATTAAMPRPTRRNALAWQLIPYALFAAMLPLGNFLGQTAFRMAPNAAHIAGLLIMASVMIAMTRELASVTGDRLVWWHFLIPIYGWYWAATKLQPAVAAAKATAGKPAARGAAVYVFLPIWAFASDLNDLADS
jgi:hypothetical protein